MLYLAYVEWPHCEYVIGDVRYLRELHVHGTIDVST